MAHTNIGLGERSANDDPVELTVDEIFAEDELDEFGAWCVDDGCAIRVMSTQQIRDALASGELSPRLKTWRDGHACWLPIHDQPELYDTTVTPAPVVVDLDAAADGETVAFMPPAPDPARLDQQAAHALRAGVLVSLALLATFGSFAYASAARAGERVERARHLELRVPEVTVAEHRPPKLSWSPPFGEPMSGFRRASR